MVLGIIVTSDRHPHHVAGLVRAAKERGHEVRVFVTDEGVRLAAHSRIASLHRDIGVEMTYCLQSARLRNLPKEYFPEGVQSGSQYNNAKLIQISDKVITV